MDPQLLFQIDEELDSSEVAEICFLCRDFVSAKKMEGITNARELFRKLEEKCLLDSSYFLSQLLQTIGRRDLLSRLVEDLRQPVETDAKPLLPKYRVMLYRLYENLDRADLEKLKYLLSEKLGRRQTELCNTVLDLFTEMEKRGLLSNTKLDELEAMLREVDQQLASNVQFFMQHVNVNQQPGITLTSVVGTDLQPAQIQLPVPETQPRGMSRHPLDLGQNVFSDAEPTVKPSPLADDAEYYALIHNPRGLCVVFSNENFKVTNLGRRGGTTEDEKSLSSVFTQFGFTVKVHKDLTATDIRHELTRLGKRNFWDEDALVVCVLSHGEKGCFYGTDGVEVSLEDVTQPFKSRQAPTLAGKPKLFFIQACQGQNLQKGCVTCPSRPVQEEAKAASQLEEDAGPVKCEVVPDDADFLIGMATVQDFKSFRHTKTGSIYIQELCHQLRKSAESLENDDILSILTRVNREVSKGEFLNHKQMPEPKYTLTKKLVLKYVQGIHFDNLNIGKT